MLGSSKKTLFRFESERVRRKERGEEAEGYTQTWNGFSVKHVLWLREQGAIIQGYKRKRRKGQGFDGEGGYEK